ncbi:MAG: SGNH/GDSL hydrolase family protein [Solirubrobacterales bacterium]|nr:SGNH/GDSL hydrolase family protein [Solirubrobacterales bacterium]MCB0859797.1 SGNH/GDSL hydrolase family protein [Solirubrobacterales bacterium]
MLRPLLALLAAGLLLAGCGSGSNSPSSDQEPGSSPQPSVDVPSTQSEPVLPDLSGAAGERLRQEVARADEEKMNPEVFAKVGDSNTEWPQNIYGLGCREVGYGSNGDLRTVVARYSKVKFPDLAGLPGCSPVNSLTRRSAAAVSGVWTEWLMTPTADLPATGIAPPTDECEPQQTPLECEIELIRPRWALIMSGTNDALLGLPLGATYKRELGKMIDRVRQLGPVPVLSTLPPMAVPAHNGQPGEERVDEADRIIRKVARQKQVSLIDLHQALTASGMVDQGLASDGLHLGVYGGEDQPDVMRGSALLTIPALHYGANRRNLIWLQVLERLDQAVGE